MSGLDPTVTGALIAGGFAIVGGGLTAINTRATLRANRAVDRDSRLWEKKTALYEDLYTAVNDLEEVLDRAEREGIPGPDGVILQHLTDDQRADFLHRREGARWSEANLDGLRPRMHLYASDKVERLFTDLLLHLIDPELWDALRRGAPVYPKDPPEARERWEAAVASDEPPEEGEPGEAISAISGLRAPSPRALSEKIERSFSARPYTYWGRAADHKRELLEEMRLDLQQQRSYREPASPAMVVLMSVRHPIAAWQYLRRRRQRKKAVSASDE